MWSRECLATGRTRSMSTTVLKAFSERPEIGARLYDARSAVCYGRFDEQETHKFPAAPDTVVDEATISSPGSVSLRA